MEILIGAHQISKSFSSRSLFEGLTFSIEAGERVGLIGPNGAGKSTLLKILAGKADLDGGRLSVKKGLRIGYLEQVPQFGTEATVHSTLLEGSTDPDDWQEIARVQEISSKLSLSDFSPETPVGQLSGGWKKRLALARELIRNPDLLLLDEPTNHLDVESILWLEDMLARAPFATLTITHDRVFLQSISKRIIELDRRHPDGLLSVDGDYAHFVTVREQQLAAQQTRETKLSNRLRRENEWLSRGPIARLKKQQARIEAAHDLSDTVDELSQRNQRDRVKLEFHGEEKNPKKLIEAKGISKSFGDQMVIPKMDLLITPKSRIGLMGPNGCGKTTLIRLLTQTEKPDQGSVQHADRLQVSYFEQNRESLNPDETLFKSICPQGDHVEYAGQFVHARSYLARFLFNYDQMETEVRKLSGGEQSRLLLARLMLTKANLLVLDEPTNDLDMDTLDVLSDVLQEFNGAILLVTHDRYFLDQMTNQILAFGVDQKGNKKIFSMVGLAQWQDWHAEQTTWRAQLAQSPKSKSEPAPQAPKRKLSYNEQRELDLMESRILEAEAELEKWTGELETAAADPARLTEVSQKLAAAQTEVDRLYARWEELS
ncbi:MAG: ABC-F family ATP-binding cassette domain-containing protein [Bdellovibrionales bacterium]